MILKLELTQHHLNYYNANMKKLILSAILSFLFFLPTFATEKKAFDDFLKKTNAVTIYDKKSYEKLAFTNSKTGEKKKFVDFPEKEQFALMINHICDVGYNMGSVYEKWEEELKAAEDTPDSNTEASKQDIRTYMKQLFDIRKKNAEELEKLLDVYFNKYAKDFSDEDKQHILNNIRSYHDKSKLIKRDK